MSKERPNGELCGLMPCWGHFLVGNCGVKAVSMLAGGRCECRRRKEASCKVKNPTWSFKLGCQNLNWGGLWNNFCNYTLLCLEGGDRQHQLHIQIQSFALGHGSTEDRWWKEQEPLRDARKTESSRCSHVEAVRVCCLSWAAHMQDNKSLRTRKRKA